MIRIQTLPIGLLLIAAFSSAAFGETFIDRLKTGQPQKIVFYGTSVTAAGWANDVTPWLAGKFPNLVTGKNNGKPGWQSDQGLAGLKELVLSEKPDVVFLEFAINDAHERFKITPEKAKANLTAMIDQILAQNPKAEIILQTMNTVFDTADKTPAKSRPNLDAYYQVYRDVAADRKLLLIDHARHWAELQKKNAATYKSYLPDGLHPSSKATKDFVTPFLKERLQAASGK